MTYQKEGAMVAVVMIGVTCAAVWLATYPLRGAGRSPAAQVLDCNRYLHQLERDLGPDIDLRTSVMLERAATLRDRAVESDLASGPVRRYLAHAQEVAVRVESQRRQR